MEYFRNAQVVRLRSLNHRYLFAFRDEKTVCLNRDGYSANARWSVEFVPNSDSVLCLKSHYGKYLAASDQPSLVGMTGCKVLQSLPPLLDSSLELEPVMEGTHVKLRTHYGTFLRANGDHPFDPDSVTHDLPHHTTILWDVDIIEREEEGYATDIDGKASEEGSATKRRHKTGEGSSVTKSAPGDSGLIREGIGVKYRGHFWKLKSLLLDDSGRKDVLVRGGLGTTALVRELCADVREHFDTIAWISIPQKNDSELIREEILLQLIFERAAFPEYFDRNPWMLRDSEFSLQQRENCLIVVDNLNDSGTWKKFEEVLRIVKTCRVIFIVRHGMDSSSSQICQYGRKCETYELEDLSFVPRGYNLKDFLEEGFPSPLKGVCQLILRKCEELPTAIVFVLRNQMEPWLNRSSEIIKDEWEARIPLVNLCHELHIIQKVLKTLCKDLYKDLYDDEGHELDPIQLVLEILRKDDRGFCFLYLGIFPENSPISCKRVSRLWAAEGLLPKLERAEHFFKDDRLRKCIHPVERRSDGELSTFQVDKRVREIIVALSDLRNLVTITNQVCTNWPERVRCLSVQGRIRALNEKKPVQLSSIFSLGVSSNEDKTTTSGGSPSETSETTSFPYKLEHSKVLDLTGAPFQIIPDGLFELTNLRYLSIRNTSINVIPTSIGNLTNLEFLDAKHSLITNLPPDAARLQEIRHILIYHHEKDPLRESYNLIGFKASCKIRVFRRLEKICFVESDDNMLADLGNLTELRRLGITKLSTDHGKKLCSALEKLEKLKSLNVHAMHEDEIIDLHGLSSPPKNLKHLYLHGRLEKLPDWISYLNDLTKIILRWSHLEEDLLATLGQLPKLVELELRQAYDGEQLDFRKGQFRNLKILLLDELEGLISMSLEKGTMPSLENLTISRCQWLERIPSGIKHIRAKKLTFFDMSREFYDMVRADHEKDHYRNFEHIPEVYFTRWRAGHMETYQVESTDEAHCSSHQVKSNDRSHQVESTDEAHCSC